MADSDPSRVLLVVGGESADSVASALESETGYDVKTETDTQRGRDRLAWPDIDAVVCVHRPPEFDAAAFVASIEDTYPRMPTYVVGDGEDSSWFDRESLPTLAGHIAGRLDERDAGRSLEQFDDGDAERYPNVDEAAVDDLLAGDIDRETAADLLHKRQLLDAIFRTIPAHLFVKDRQGRHRYVSERYFDEDPEAFRNRADPEIPYVAADHAWRAYEDDRYVIDEGEAILGKEEYLPALDKWNDTSKVPWYDDDGDIVGLLGVTYEVTERKERRQEIEQQNERLREFARLVSHDLRNPLQVAQSAIELARDDVDSERLDTATSALERMDEIIEDVLMLATYGQSVIDPEPLDLPALVAQAWGIAGGAESRLETESDIDPIQGDRGHVQQLLENLFRNAVEHANGDGAVLVRVGPLADGFYVEDDGPGIPPAQREKVLEAGYSTGTEGTGFGLVIVEEIVDAHGWTLTITESSAGGARFEVRGVDFAEANS